MTILHQVEAIVDRLIATADTPSDKNTFGSGATRHLSTEQAVADGDSAVKAVAQHTADVGASADAGRDIAAFNAVACACCEANHGSSMLVACDGACHAQVFDDGTTDTVK